MVSKSTFFHHEGGQRAAKFIISMLDTIKGDMADSMKYAFIITTMKLYCHFGRVFPFFERINEEHFALFFGVLAVYFPGICH
jgi:hypothetical protein